MTAPRSDSRAREPAPQWQAPPASGLQPYALKVGQALAGVHQPWRQPRSEPAAADPSKGELNGTDLVAVIEGRGTTDLTELWALDPSDPRLVHGEWVLEGEGLERLRELHRTGLSLNDYDPDGQASTWTDELLQLAMIGGGVIAILYLLIMWNSGPMVVPGWPMAPLIGAVVASVAGLLAWLRKERWIRSLTRPARRQVNALSLAIGRLRVRAPSPAAAELAVRIRTAWADATRNLEPERLASAEWVALGRRVDELLHALALSQPSGRRPMRPDLLRSAERRIEPLIDDIARAVDRPALDGSPGAEPTITTEGQPVIHYPRYDPRDPS